MGHPDIIESLGGTSCAARSTPVNTPSKTGSEERLDQEELFARLGSIFTWQKDLSVQLLAPGTTNGHRKQVKVGLEYLELIEWMVRGALHRARAKTKRENIGGAFSYYPHPEAIDAPCACGFPYTCRLAGLTRDELSRRLKIARQTIRRNYPRYQNSLNALGMTAADPLWPERRLATASTRGKFRSWLRRSISNAFETQGPNADYKAVGKFLMLEYRALVLPPRLIKGLPPEAMKKTDKKFDLDKLLSKRTNFTKLFEKEVSYVRARIR
jgi:hypothetical protein